MAVPTPVVRATPTGTKMPDGFSSKIAMALLPGIGFWEKTVKPGALDGGDPIVTSTMHNIRWHTAAPRTLVKVDSFSSAVSYDPDVLVTVLANMNINTTITALYPDGSTYSFYGWLQKFEPSELKEGEMPEATVTFVPSNYDPVNNVEQGPVLVPHVGT